MPPPYCYDYPRPAVTVDLVLFALDGDELRTLLVRRKHEPFAGHWAFPGGFLEIDEPVEVGVRRELREETGLDFAGPLAFLGAYAAPSRDPRGRTISLAHVAAIAGPPPGVAGGDDAAEAAWTPARVEARPLAFDHDTMLGDAIRWLQVAVDVGRSGLDLLPDEFGIDEARTCHVAVFGTLQARTPGSIG